MPEPPKHSVSVAGIVIDDQDRVLVIRRRDNNHWEPPGGVLELHETSNKASTAKSSKKPASPSPSTASPASTRTPTAPSSP